MPKTTCCKGEWIIIYIYIHYVVYLILQLFQLLCTCIHVQRKHLGQHMATYEAAPPVQALKRCVLQFYGIYNLVLKKKMMIGGK